MSDQLQISAELRTDVGKGASRRLRRLADRIPGILYGGKGDPVSLSMNSNELGKVMEQEAFYSQVLSLNLDNNKEDVIVRDVQRHPAKPRVLHVDFLRVDANTAIVVSVPLHFLNEDTCVGVKTGGGIITHSLTEVEISSLPGDLPEFIEVDMLEVDLNQVVHLSDLVFPTGVTPTAFLSGDDNDLVIAGVQEVRGSSEEDEAAAAEGDAEGEAGAGEESSEEDS